MARSRSLSSLLVCSAFPLEGVGRGNREGERRTANRPADSQRERARGPMASLYQRFTGKINTSRSFPAPPEASHLLGGQGPEDDGAGPKPLGSQAPTVVSRERGSGGAGAGGRPRFQYQARSDCDDEDVRASWWVGGGTGLGPSTAGDRGEFACASDGLRSPCHSSPPPALLAAPPKTLLSGDLGRCCPGAGLCLPRQQPGVGDLTEQHSRRRPPRPPPPAGGIGWGSRSGGCLLFAAWGCGSKQRIRSGCADKLIFLSVSA